MLNCVYSIVKKIDSDYVKKFNSEIKNYGIEFNENKNNYFDSYHCDENLKKTLMIILFTD